MDTSTSSFAPHLSSTIVSVNFVRNRNALLVRADLGALFVDFMLHAADNRLDYSEQAGRMMKEGLAAFALHCASRPRGEHLAWTLNFQEPLLNLFFTGDNEDCLIAGRVFSDDVRRGQQNLLYSDIVARRGQQPRRSVVHFDGTSLFGAAEAYYARSEQRSARYFELGGDEFALLLSHPDCDLVWLHTVDAAGIRAMSDKETLSLIERREYRWQCGCTQTKLMRVISQTYKGDMRAMFAGEQTIRAQCPRCAAVHVITQEAMAAYLAEAKKEGS
jgi:molecular chaperone Hsp33